MFAQTHVADHNGIPVFWADLPATITGTLMFGVGHRDEPLRLGGITHLVEHLVFRAVEPILLVHDGETDEDSLTFYASGTAAQVSGFLNDIAASIRNIAEMTDAQFALEKSIIAAEIEGNYLHASPGLTTYRYGATGAGLINFSSPTTFGLTREEVIDWAKRWLTADNAAICFTGPIPDSLDVALPRGEVRHESLTEPVIQTPILVESEKEGIAVSFQVDAELAPFLGDAIYFELHRRLRHDAGLIYSPHVFQTVLDGRTVQLDFILDPTEKTFAATLKSGVDSLRDVAERGFSEEAVAYARNQCVAHFGYENSLVAAYLDRMALDRLRDRQSPTPQAVLTQAASLNSADLTTALRKGMPTLLVAFSGDEELEEGFIERLGIPVDPFSAWQEVDDEKRRRRGRKGEVWRSKRGGDAPGTTSILRDDHVLMQSFGETVRMDLVNIALVGKRECDCLEFIDARGRHTVVDPDDWHRGNELVEALLARVPAELVRPFPGH